MAGREGHDGGPEGPRKTRTRALLTGQMIALAAARGYAATTVGDLVAATGVGRSSFYENFGDKAGCFRVALRESAADLGAEVLARFERTDGEPWRLAGAIAEAAAGDPDRARVLCVESLAGPGGLAVRKGLLADWEDLVCAGEAAGATPLAVPPRTLLGAVVRMLAVRLLDGGPLDLHLARELEGWWRCYRIEGEVPPPLGTGGPAPRPAAPVPPATRAAPIDPALGLGMSTVRERRRRILIALIARCAEVGYSSLSVAEVLEAAGVSRKAFYAEFEGKEEALLAAHEAIFQTAMSACAGAFFGAGPWPARAWQGGGALLRFLDADPAAARVGFLEGPAAGHASARLVYRRAGAFVVFLSEGFRAFPQVAAPAVVAEALMATMFEWAATELWRSPDPRFLTGHPELAAVILIPFLGVEGARSTIEKMLGDGLPT